MTKRLILASASPRRQELLALLRLPFQVSPSHVDEDDPEFAPAAEDVRAPADYAARLAYEKAWDVFNQIRFEEIPTADENIILAADTIVVAGGEDETEFLAKPKDEQDARTMLAKLSGSTHSVFTGLCLMECECDPSDGEWVPFWNTAVVETRVTFRDLQPGMIDAYLATGEPFDKAGAYGIQGFASTFVEQIEGDYFNVVGLPVCTVARMLEKIGIEWWRGESALS